MRGQEHTKGTENVGKYPGRNGLQENGKKQRNLEDVRMKLNIEEKEILFVFGCRSYDNTLYQLKWITALTVEEKVKRRVLAVARKPEKEGIGEWYTGVYRQLCKEMEGYFEAKNISALWRRIQIWRNGMGKLSRYEKETCEMSGSLSVAIPE